MHSEDPTAAFDKMYHQIPHLHLAFIAISGMAHFSCISYLSRSGPVGKHVTQGVLVTQGVPQVPLFSPYINMDMGNLFNSASFMLASLNPIFFLYILVSCFL